MKNGHIKYTYHLVFQMSPQTDHLISLMPKRPEKEKINSFLSKQTCSEVLECINEDWLSYQDTWTQLNYLD